jgi:hypothetical protein
MSENPYQTPTVSEVAALAEPLSEAAVIRQAHLKHEASLKGMGSLYFLSGALVLLSVVEVSWILFGSKDAGDPQGRGFAILFVLLIFVPLQFACWWGLRKLKSWVLIPACILSALALVGFPIGTVIGVYFLYLLLSKKGRFILSPAYGEIVARTSDMKYRTPRWNWIVLAIIVICIVGGVIYLTL